MPLFLGAQCIFMPFSFSLLFLLTAGEGGGGRMVICVGYITTTAILEEEEEAADPTDTHMGEGGTMQDGATKRV